MRRGARLARLRVAGVPDPHLYVRSDREMYRALHDFAQQELPASFFAKRKICPWCPMPLKTGEIACAKHLAREQELREEFSYLLNGET